MKRRKFMSLLGASSLAFSTVSSLYTESAASLKIEGKPESFSESKVSSDNLVFTLTNINISTYNIRNVDESLKLEILVNTDRLIDYQKIDVTNINLQEAENNISIGPVSYDLSNQGLNIKDSSIVRVLVKVDHPDIDPQSSEITLVEPSEYVFRETWSDGFENWNTVGSTRSSGGSYGHSIVNNSVTGQKSCRVYANANCATSPYDGSYAEVNRDIDLDSGEYEIEYWSKVEDYGFFEYTSGATASEGRIYLDSDRIAIIEDMCRSENQNGCTTDWIRNKETFTISSSGSHKLRLRFFASDCKDGYVYWDDIRIRNK